MILSEKTIAISAVSKHLFFAVLTLLTFCLAGFNAVAQDKIPFGPNDTLDEIRAKIKHNGYNFTVDHNWVFDLSPKQKARMFKASYAPRPGDNIPVPNTDIILKPTKSSLPAALDWRNKDGHSYIGPIRNQGNSCACVTFGCTDAASLSYNVTNGLYDQNCAEFSVMYFLWTLAYSGKYFGFGYSGGDLEYEQFYALMKTGGVLGAAGFEGAISEANFPFVDSMIPPSQEMIEKSKTYPRVTFKNWNRCMPVNYLDTTEQIKEAIAAHGSVAVQVNQGASAFHAYRSGIYEDTNTMPDKIPYYNSTFGHGVSLVGWDDNPPEGGGGCWILRNEWGTGWGDKGYMRIRYFSAMVNGCAAYVVAGESAGQYTIRGTVKGSVYQGATMSLTGSDTSAITTGLDGKYALGDLVAGTYTVTPTYPSCSFDPPSRTVTLPAKAENGDFIECDFTSKITGPMLTVAVSPDNKGIACPPDGNKTPLEKDQWMYISARTADVCYAFKEWNISGNAELKHDKSSAVNEIRLSGDAGATAAFEYKGPPEQVVLSMGFYMGVATGTMTPDQGEHNVPYNTPVKIEVIPFNDFLFLSWGVKGSAVVENMRNPSTTVTLQGYADVMPVIKQKNYQATMCVSPDNSGSTNPAPGPHAFPFNVEVEIQAVPADGYYFDNWTGEGSEGPVPFCNFKDIRNPRTTVTIIGNAKVIANFKKIVNTGALTMAVSPENSGTTNPAVGTHAVPSGAWTEIDAIPADGYFFENWIVEGSAKIDSPNSIKTLILFPDNDGAGAQATATANFAKIVNTVTLTMAVGGPDFSESSTNPGAGDHVVHAGAWTNIEAVPAEGWFFDKWIFEGDAEIIDVFSMETAVSLNGNATVTAYFKPAYTTATLTMAVTPDNSGSTNPSTGDITVNVGEHIGIQAIPSDGFFFDKWTVAGDADIRDPYDDTTSVVLSDDDTVTANFAPILTTAALTLAATPDASGSTNPGVGAHIVPCGKHTQIEAIPINGYFFEKWTSAGGAEIVDAYNDKTSVVLSAEATVTANFAVITNTATLTMAVYPSSYSGSVNPGTGTHVVAVGENVQIEAVPSDGHYFERWTSSNGNAVIQNPLDATTSVAASGDSTVTAVFSTNPDFDDMAFGKIYTLDIYYVMGLVDFAKTPRAYCQYISPVSQKPRHTSLKVAGRIKEKATTVDLEWDSRIALLPRKVWTADRKKTCEQILEANPPDTLTCSLFASGTDSEKNSVRKMGTGIDLMLNPPEIAGIYNQDGRKITSAAAGEAITVKGMYFGKAIPAIWLEYPDKSGKIKQLRLKIDRKSLIYLDYEGNPSCMDKDDGRSQFSTAIPKRLPRNWNYGIQHNLVINNRVCRSTTKFQTQESKIWQK